MVAFATTPPADPPHAYVIEYRPLDRCFVPECHIRTRNVAGYANTTQDDGDPGAYVAHGEGTTTEQFLERGLVLRPGETYSFDLPPAEYASELDVYFASNRPRGNFEASIIASELVPSAAPVSLTQTTVSGATAAFMRPQKGAAGDFERYGRHARVALPSRSKRALRITIVNRGTTKLDVGSPLVMRRVEGRGPRQALFAIFDAVPFHQLEALLSKGTGDPRADWLKTAIADRGVYFSDGVSPGQGTNAFVIRWFRNEFFAEDGWPGLYGLGLDETMPVTLPGPIARAAEQGFVAHFVGNNYLLMPTLSHIGWDTAYQSELKHHATAMAVETERWSKEHPDDDAVIVWWNSSTHVPYPPGRNGSPPPEPEGLPLEERFAKDLSLTWPNVLEGSDVLHDTYEALRRASPNASRMVWIGEDHSRGISGKMLRRPYRVPSRIDTTLSHACGGTIEESSTRFAFFFDEPRGEGSRARLPRTVTETTSSFIAWRAFESRFGVDVGLPSTSSFVSPIFPGNVKFPVWDDRIMFSGGLTSTLRATMGKTSYAVYLPKISQEPVWSLSPDEQLVLVGAPTRSEGVLEEELYDDTNDPYEYTNLAGAKLDVTVKMRREMADFMAAHFDDASHPRHRNKLVFSEPVELDLFAPRPFTVIADGVPVVSSDPRLARVRAKELVIVEGKDPVGILEVRGANGPLVLKCSANGLPLDALSSERLRLNLAVARLNCPLRETPRDKALPGEVLFSFEAGAPGTTTETAVVAAPKSRGGAANDDLMAGMKRWGYVRDIDKEKP